MMVVLGGIGTLWGGALGAALVVELNDYLATAGFEEIGIVTGSIFVVIVLVFRRGIWGTARDLLEARSARHRSAPSAAESRPTAHPERLSSPA